MAGAAGPGPGPFAAAAPQRGAAPSHGPDPGPAPDTINAAPRFMNYKNGHEKEQTFTRRNDE